MARYQFDVFELDVECARLTGPNGEIRLRAKAFRLLTELLQAAPHIVSSEKLLDRVWGTRHLTRNTVAQTMQEVRSALKPLATTELIDNLPRLGYRVIVGVTRFEGLGPMAAETTDRIVEQSVATGAETAIAPTKEPVLPELQESATDSTPSTETKAPGLLPRMLLGWTAWRWALLAVSCITGVVLAILVLSEWRTHRDSSFRSAADLGIRIEGRGAEQVGDAVSHMLAQAIERRWGVRPVNLAPVGDGQLSHPSASDSAALARKYRVDVWYTAHFSLNEVDGKLVLDGEILLGDDNGTSTISIPVQSQPVENILVFSDLLANRLADLGAWDHGNTDPASEQISAQGMVAYAEADVLLSRGQPDAALGAISKLDPDLVARPEFAALSARAYLTQGRLAEALEVLPEDTRRSNLRLLRARAARLWPEAVETAKRMLDADPKSARLGLDYVQVLIDSGNLNLALSELESLSTQAQSEFDLAEFSVLKATILNEQGAFAETEAMLTPVLARMRDARQSELNIRGRQVMANSVAMQGRWEEALDLHLAIRSDALALGLQRIEADAAYHIADLLRALGRRTEAEQTLTEAITRFDQPNTRDQLPDLQLGLAYMKLDAGNLEATSQLADEAAATLSTYRNVLSDAPVSALRSEVSMLRGAMQRSVDQMRAAIAIDRSLAAHNEASRRLVRLAFRLWLSGAHMEAERALDEARVACETIGNPQSCGFAVSVLGQGKLDPNVDSKELLEAFEGRRRGLRELYTVAIASLARGRPTEAAALVDFGNRLMPESPAHYQSMFALVAAMSDAESGSPVKSRYPAVSAQFPELNAAIDWLALPFAQRTTACQVAGNEIIAGFCSAHSR